MPTYTCWSERGTVPPETRAAVAGAITEIHHEVARAPRYFVQVVFTDLEPRTIYLAGHPVEAGHVWIRADIRAGRTDEQKREMLRRLTTEVGEILGVAPESVWVYLSDIPGPSVAEYGRPLPEPGQEDVWFAALPAELQERLKPIR